MSYELKSARFLARDVLLRAVKPGDRAVDATMGNGHDTVLLCGLVGPEGKVYAFDVQPEAVERTRNLLREQGLEDRAELFCRSHAEMESAVSGGLAAAVFNLGWLPGGNHAVTTRWESTRAAVEAALRLLKPDGVLVICAYPGHPEGERELEELIRMLSSLSSREYNVLRQCFLNASPGAPECFVVQKQSCAGRV